MHHMLNLKLRNLPLVQRKGLNSALYRRSIDDIIIYSWIIYFWSIMWMLPEIKVSWLLTASPWRHPFGMWRMCQKKAYDGSTYWINKYLFLFWPYFALQEPYLGVHDGECMLFYTAASGGCRFLENFQKIQSGSVAHYSSKKYKKWMCSKSAKANLQTVEIIRHRPCVWKWRSIVFS